MQQLEILIDRILSRVNLNLRPFNFKVDESIRNLVSSEKLTRFYGFYGVTSQHPLQFNFSRSNVGGSYFLGKCVVDHSILHKCDIRGDELKRKGDTFEHNGGTIVLGDDEIIRIRDSFLIHTLVHNYSHDPEHPEEFLIQNTAAAHYANIHGAPVEGCFLGPFATVDLCTLHGCKIGTFSYVQAGDLFHENIPDGTIWVKRDNFEFRYTFDEKGLAPYIHFEPGKLPEGIIMDFVESRKEGFREVFENPYCELPIDVPEGSAVSPYSVIRGQTVVQELVLVSQRAYLDSAWMGPGANAQENSYIINSRLEKNDVTAHGAKIINAHLAERVFVGFNSFVRGAEGNPLKIGKGCMVMPHTIIDLEEGLEIPAETAVWGLIRNAEDLKLHSIALKDLETITGEVSLGNMVFKGNGKAFADVFRKRIDHILEVNGAYYKETGQKGHAQDDSFISFNIIQPYLTGRYKGLFPTIDIRP
ncbi:transferase [Desulfobotulus sp.]|uniref:transferase n=1 Tax=Desulfobotulus sp. TaxID=1940337 RepID=UPI002A35EF2E|nr:transferase [Desulfobotulus sp.]MDY0164505.1 transferase [Desulfobotulus sp.]